MPPRSTDLARSVLGEPAANVARWRVEPVDYDYGSPTTDGLFRIRVTTRSAAPNDRGPCSSNSCAPIVIGSSSTPAAPTSGPRPSPGISGAMRRTSTDQVCRARWPRDSGWPPCTGSWTSMTIAWPSSSKTSPAPTPPGTKTGSPTAANLLGTIRRAGHPPRQPTGSAFRQPSAVTRSYYIRAVAARGVPRAVGRRALAAPLAGGATGLRRDLDQLAGRVPAILDVLESLPQLVVHGDASPQNLLVPTDGSAKFVIIDWTLGGPAAVGDDLGQLLVGWPMPDGSMSRNCRRCMNPRVRLLGRPVVRG